MLTADQLIDAYVADVARLLPRGQRDDVAMELRALLHDEIDAAAAGEPARRDEAAREYLTGFGRPAEVAARYGTPVSLIDPADTRWFLRLAVLGSALLLFGGLLDVLSRHTGSGSLQDAVRVWWPTAWPHVFTLLGVLLAVFAFGSWKRRRWPSQTAWRPHALPTNRINRTGRAAALAFWIAGTIVLVKPDWFFRMPAARTVFAYNDGFLRLRGPVLLAMLTLAIALQAVLVVDGKWRTWTRNSQVAVDTAMCAVLTWIVAAPVFQAAPTDETMRGSIALIALLTFADLGFRAWRRPV